MFAQLLQTAGVRSHVLRVVQAVADDHVHQPQRQRQIAPREDAEHFVGGASGAVGQRVDHIELRPAPPRLHNERPVVDVGAQDVRAPRDDQLRVDNLLGLAAVAEPGGRGEPGPARRRADGPVQLRRAQPVKEPAVHAGPVEKPDRARVAVWENRLRPELRGHAPQPPRDSVQSLVPADALEAALAFGAHAPLRIEQPAG